MEQLELHDGQLTGVSILAAKGSHLGDGPGGFAVCTMCREELIASQPPAMRLLCGFGHDGGLDINSICC